MLPFVASLALAFLLVGCGPCGGPGTELLRGLPYFVLTVFAAILCVFGYFVVRDAFRFGRMGMSWLVAAIGSGIFSGAGYFFAGLVGTAAGAPFLIAFGLGRYRRRHTSKNESKNEDAA